MNEKSAKSHLRQELRQRLGALSFSERVQASRQIGQRLTGGSLWSSVRWVYAFAPLASEPDLTQWHWLGKSLALPRVTANGLEFFSVSGFDDLECHRLGMREPRRGAEQAEPPDLILVPGLGFDRDGGRIGRGGGYYDRFLATLPNSVPRLGIGFECQLGPVIIRESHDVTLHGVITERGAWLSAASQGWSEVFASPDHSVPEFDPESEWPRDKI